MAFQRNHVSDAEHLEIGLEVFREALSEPPSIDSAIQNVEKLT